jgi:hypothetical protein
MTLVKGPYTRIVLTIKPLTLASGHVRCMAAAPGEWSLHMNYRRAGWEVTALSTCSPRGGEGMMGDRAVVRVSRGR